MTTGNTELCYLTIAEASGLMRSGKLSPVELTRAHLERMATVDRVLNAYITVLADRAMNQARLAEAAYAAGRVASPLQGVPIAVKDLVYTRGVRTTAGSAILAHFVPHEDATVIERFAAAGAVLLGKLNLSEFAMGGTMVNVHFGATRNPWNTDHFPGGSSSGSGAAAAAGLAMGAIGTDTGGSIRGPASNCGIVGLKPTYGRVSKYGVVPLSWSLDHVGPMTRTAEDCALMLGAIAGYDPKDMDSANVPVEDYTAGLKEGVRGLRIGVLRKDFFVDLSEEVARGIEAALGVFGELGAAVQDVALGRSWDGRALYNAVVYPEATAYHRGWMQTRIQDYGPNCRTRLEQGVSIPATEHAQAQEDRKAMRRDYLAPLAGVDVLVAPSSVGTAPRLDAPPAGPGGPSFSNPFNLTGLPALALPIGFSKDGLPLSLQLIGRPFGEATVLRAAQAYQEATGWWRERPGV